MGARKPVRTVSVCRASKCRKRGSCELARLLDREVEARGLRDAVKIRLGGCNDLCKRGPTIAVQPDRVWYADLTPEAVGHIVGQHLGGGEPVRRWLARWKGSPAKKAAKAARKEREAARQTEAQAREKACATRRGAPPDGGGSASITA